MKRNIFHVDLNVRRLIYSLVIEHQEATTCCSHAVALQYLYTFYLNLGIFHRTEEINSSAE